MKVFFRLFVKQFFWFYSIFKNTIVTPLFCSILFLGSCSSLYYLLVKQEIQAIPFKYGDLILCGRILQKHFHKEKVCKHLGSRCFPLCRLQLHCFPLRLKSGSTVAGKICQTVTKECCQWKRSNGGKKPISYRKP